MKKSKKTMLIAAALTAAAGLAGCTNDPSDSEVANVYGPPADYSQEVSESDEPAEDVPESIAEDSSEYSPAEEEIAGEDESIAEDSSEYEPSEEEIPAVYGPPPVALE